MVASVSLPLINQSVAIVVFKITDLFRWLPYIAPLNFSINTNTSSRSTSRNTLKYVLKGNGVVMMVIGGEPMYVKARLYHNKKSAMVLMMIAMVKLITEKR